MSQEEAAPARQRTLQEAQLALLERRAALQRARAATAPASAGNTAVSCWPSPCAPTPAYGAAVAALPDHLSWESARLTAVLRRAAQREQVADTGWLAALAAEAAETPASSAQPSPPPTLTSAQAILYPDLEQAILRARLAAPGRLWHLLRVLDAHGRGWLALDEALAAFTGPGAPLRFCGRRQLRHLLAQGDAAFWRVENGRIWLRAPARVAAALGLERLAMRPVALPARELTGGIAAVRAHFYASFHSGRKRSAPVSRRVLAKQTGVAPRTQRTYDRAIHVGRRANYARGPRLNSAAAETLAWQKGPACFTFSDHQGRNGAKGARYLAWQLPNSYDGPHAPCARGRQKRAQRHLADLLTKGTTGNDQEAAGREVSRTYFAGPRAAAQAYGRSAAAPLYWPMNKANLWYCLY